MHPSRWIVVTLLVTTLVAALAPATAHGRSKQSITARVNGHRVKFGRKLISTTGSAETGGLATGGGQKVRHLGQLVRGLVFGCAVALAGPTFPVEGQYCTMGYSETKVSRNPVFRQWAAVDGVSVTVASFDGNRVTGTFSGTLPPANPGADYGPVTVTDGSFSVLLQP